VAYKDAHEKGTARQAVAVDAPDRFRLELFSPIGIVSLVTTDGHNLAAYFPQDKVLYRGAATPTNTARFIQLALSASEITGLLLGLPVLPDQREAGVVRFDEDAGWYRLDLPLTEGDVQTLAFDQKTLRLLGWEVRNGEGAVLARVTLSDYRPVRNQEFPFAIELSDKQGKQEAAITYEQVELNPPLSDSLFTLVSIPGVQEIDLDTLAAP
jgi:outer membrane lipoprotein-sorting protein